jgi:hypothetical protein
MSNKSAFSRLATHLIGLRKRWYKQYTHRRNRKRLRQSRDIENHRDKPLDPWAID